MPSTDKYAPTAWAVDPTEELTCPSGQVCMVQRVSPTTLLQSGLLDASDLLSQIAGTHIDRVRGKVVEVSDDAVAQVLKDPKKVSAAMVMMDQLVCAIVVEPNVQPVPNFKAGERRVPGTVYTDMINETDKTFIVQWAMKGQQEVAPFPEGHRPSAGTVGDVKKVSGKARKSTRPRA